MCKKLYCMFNRLVYYFLPEAFVSYMSWFKTVFSANISWERNRHSKKDKYDRTKKKKRVVHSDRSNNYIKIPDEDLKARLFGFQEKQERSQQQ